MTNEGTPAGWVLCRLDGDGTVTGLDGPVDEVLGAGASRAVGRPVTELAASDSPVAALVATWAALARRPRGSRRDPVAVGARTVIATTVHRPVAGGAEILLVVDGDDRPPVPGQRPPGRRPPGAVRCDLSLLTAAVDEAVAEDAESVLVAVVDLDGFAELNERHGRAAGDAVLDAVGERLRSMMRPVDLVCRTAADEFVLACRDVGDGGAPAISRRVTEVLAEPVSVPGGRWVPVASVGAVRPTPGEAAGTVVGRARHAMGVAKRERRAERSPLSNQ